MDRPGQARRRLVVSHPMRCAVLLVTVFAASTVAYAQAVPPWPVAHTPHPPDLMSPSVEDYSLEVPGRVPVTFHTRTTQYVLAVRRLALRSNPHLSIPSVVVGSGGCATPCTLYLPPGEITLRADAPGLRATDETFRVPVHPTDVTLRSASSTLFNLGAGLVAVGATVFVGEFVGILAAQLRGESVAPAGVLTVAIAAGVLLAAGIPLLVTQRTGFELTPR